MSDETVIYSGGPIFDGERLHSGMAVEISNGIVTAITTSSNLNKTKQHIDLKGDILSPGFVDLQVNGGDGLMLGDDPSLHSLERIASAHLQLGCAAILPTLITDTQPTTEATINATVAAIDAGVAGIAGLHLEGPHLSEIRKGAHHADLIRPMEEADLRRLLDAANRLPILKVTLAPEAVSVEQVKRLLAAGILLSLGHTDANFDTCQRYFDAGISCVTHLFNAMSPLHHREPGLVGATLARHDVQAGLIADGIHVHAAAIKAAMQAAPQRLFLVSDAMALAGTSGTSFNLHGRQITRQNNRLTLKDGTLAGADLDLTQALRVMVQDVGCDIETALRMATSIPADLIKRPDLGRMTTGSSAQLLRISPDFSGVQPIATNY